jgi:hypothetical protein
MTKWVSFSVHSHHAPTFTAPPSILQLHPQACVIVLTSTLALTNISAAASKPKLERQVFLPVICFYSEDWLAILIARYAYGGNP